MKRSSRWDIDPYGIKRPRRTFIGPALPGGQYYSQSSQARADARNYRIYNARANVRTGGFVGMEKKFYDTSLSGTALVSPTDSAGAECDPATVLCLNAPAQGDGESNRDGRQIVMKSIGVAGLISIPNQANQTATDVSGVITICLVLDTQTNGAQLNSEDVFTNPSAAAAISPFAFRNLQYVQRFRVLQRIELKMDQPTVVWDGTNVEQGGLQIPFKLYKNLNDLRVTFTGTTAGVANITDNSLHVIAYASNISTAPTINYNARLRFVG